MNVGGTGQLEETRTPLHTEDILAPHNRFKFTCQTSGVYSIQLIVYDRANNSASARQLFNYDGESKMTSMTARLSTTKQHIVILFILSSNNSQKNVLKI